MDKILYAVNGRHFATFKEAQEYLVGVARCRVESIEKDLAQAKKDLEKAESLKQE